MDLFASVTQVKPAVPGSGFNLLAQIPQPGFEHSGFNGFPPFFGVIFVLVIIVFVVAIGAIVVRMFTGLAEWSNNNQQPVLTVPAKVVARRTALSVRSNGMSGDNGNWQTGSSTSYFATFEFASGDRQEFKLSTSQYGLLAEKDTGELTFQGTRYQGFKRTVTAPVTGAPAPVAGADGFCPYCGAPVRADFKFCAQCSRPQFTTPTAS